MPAGIDSEDSEGEDLFGDNMVERDYAANDKLDAYNRMHIDDDDYSELDQDDRFVFDVVV